MLILITRRLSGMQLFWDDLDEVVDGALTVEYEQGTVLKVQLDFCCPDETIFLLSGGAAIRLPNDAWRPWKRAFTVKEAAAVLSYGESTIYDLYRRGILRGYHEGGIRILGDSILELMYQKTSGPEPANVEAAQEPEPPSLKPPISKPAKLRTTNPTRHLVPPL
jgi:hypothetical protein